MNTKLITLLFLLALLISGVYVLTYWRNVSLVPAPQDMSPAVSDDIDSIVIHISDFAFQPKERRIQVGTKVIWKNDDRVGHTVTSDTGAFESKLLGKDETFEFTFNQIGVFTYHCRPHPNMKATIIVE